MISDFADFCTWVYVIIDDIWQQVGPFFRRPGPAPMCSDSELLTIIIVSECKGWEHETEWHSHWAPYRALFPHLPERSRLNRRRRNLMEAMSLVRRMILQLLDLAQDDVCIIDSVPVEVVKFHLVPGSTGDWAAYGATFGYIASKKQTIFGYKLYLLITLNGVIVDFVLAPANADEREVAEELLAPYTDLTVIGDKGFIGHTFRTALRFVQRIILLTLPRRNQKQQLSRLAQRLINHVRALIETVNSQLAGQFQIEQTQAHSFWGLSTRLHAKLTAHTLCIYLNRLLGKEQFLQIKSLAFPN
jgi:hypothetical protein